LDRFVATCVPGVSRSQIQRWIEDQAITVNDRPARPGQKLRPGDRIALDRPAPVPLTLEPQPIPLTIVYEDADLLVIDKPAGLVVHPAAGHPDGTLVNAILAHCQGADGTTTLGSIGGALRPGIVHRLDRDTSGLLVVAKNDAAQASLTAQIKARTVVKGYWALVHGLPSPAEATIDAPVGRDPARRQQMAVIATGRPARTHYRVHRVYALRSTAGVGQDYLYTLLDLRLETGRTHQIRVHLAAIGHPVAGDPVYGSPQRDQAHPLGLTRQFLHACRLGFKLPGDGRFREFHSELPDDLQAVLRRLEPPIHPWGQDRG